MENNFGKHIQELRKQKNMTITMLANEANTSRSLISQIESGYTTPSLPTLDKIVHALGITLSDFFKQGQTEEEAHDFVVHDDKRKMLYLPDTQNIYYLLSQTAHQNFEFLLTDYAPHSDVDCQELFKHDGIECFFVLEGQLHLTIDNKTSLLNPGDSGCFDSRKPHSYTNPGETHAKLVLFSIKEDFKQTLPAFKSLKL